MCKIIAISNYDLQTKSSFETICFGTRAILFRYSEFSHEALPIKVFYPKILLNFDIFSWTNHRKRRPGRIPSQNRAKSHEKLRNTCKMSMKILQKSTKLTY